MQKKSPQPPLQRGASGISPSKDYIFVHSSVISETSWLHCAIMWGTSNFT